MFKLLAEIPEAIEEQGRKGSVEPQMNAFVVADFALTEVDASLFPLILQLVVLNSMSTILLRLAVWIAFKVVS